VLTVWESPRSVAGHQSAGNFSKPKGNFSKLQRKFFQGIGKDFPWISFPDSGHFKGLSAIPNKKILGLSFSSPPASARERASSRRPSQDSRNSDFHKEIVEKSSGAPVALKIGAQTRFN